jgi:hypothetical protein
MDYRILPVLNDVIPDDIIVTRPNYVIPLVAAAAVAAVVIGVFFKKKKGK